MTIRAATRADTPRWLEMRRALWPGTDTHAADIEAFFSGISRRGCEAVLLAVDERGAAVGFAELSIRRYAEGCDTDNVGYLEGWYVEPASRRSGVGRALVDAAEEWARAQGCTEFASDVVLDNRISAAAHDALGFIEVERVICYRKDL